MSPRFASALVSLINEPSPLLGVDGAERAAEFIGSVTGSDPAELLGSFEPAGRFARSEHIAAAAARVRPAIRAVVRRGDPYRD
ncbi:hypothetical protein [Pseudonocardia alni]|uniref:hypothetical protein n=1 Tax=Pseudonocardia alni TaxID=33907 RepID=UPI00332CFFCA